MASPVCIATWPFGRLAATTASRLLQAGKPAVDAALAGAQAVEDDPTVDSVGLGGLPDRDGVVSLDACVMDGKTLSFGAVAALERIGNPAAVARLVMEKTPHVCLAGRGALEFALANGFKPANLLTPKSLEQWQKTKPKPPEPMPGHDTVTVLCLDVAGNLGGVCSTSGLAHKLPGRVGDSPIVGAGLYVDNQAGSAGATGVGEEIWRILGSHTIVTQMRSGKSPQEACESAVRLMHQVAARRGVHVTRAAFIALDPSGRHGAAATPGTNFEYALAKPSSLQLLKAVEVGA